jgi:phosphatidylserine/phosphatidylglycerophosphate/cardiolipin synthase-like enzyme
MRIVPLRTLALVAIVLLSPVLSAQTTEERRPATKRSLTTFFSPTSRLLPAIVAEILAAENSIDIAMYSMSVDTVRIEEPTRPNLRGKSEASKRALLEGYAEVVEKYEAYRERVDKGRISIFDALAEAVDRGVQVRMVFHQGHRGDWKTFQSDQLVAVGVDLRYTTRTMHEKFGIFDGRALITGSANWSTSAAMIYNESTLLFRGHPELVARFEEEFDLLWNRSHPYPPVHD